VSDQERLWIQQALAGDRAAFSRLVEVYQVPVYNLAYRMLGNAAEAEEAAQETFLRAYTKLRTYDPERKFSTWLLSIASHYCIDRIRRRRFTWLSLDEQPELLPVSESGGGNLPEQAALTNEAREEVRRLLDGLEPGYRIPIVLRYWYDMAYSEIAEVMEISESAVKSRLHRARRRLAELVTQHQHQTRAERQRTDPLVALQALVVGKG